MQPRPDRLDVYYGSDLIGAVHNSAPLAFEYAPAWVGSGQRMSLAAIPLLPGRQATPEVQAFFENLLPEGELRDDLAAQRKASTIFSLLLEVAGDTAGAFLLVAPGQTPEPPRDVATTWEAIVMRAAALAGLPTAEVFYEPRTEACVVRRFDRQLRPDGTLARLVQYDLCQLAGTVSERKYEKEGGPGLAACAKLIRRYSTQPAVDLRHLVRWAFFNLCVGNNDSHAKTLSIYSVPGQGVALTPFYDLMCTRLYPGLSPEFALAIGGEVRPGAMGAENLALMGRELGMQPRFLAQQARDMADRVPTAIDQATREIAPLLTPSARRLAARLARFVSSTTQKLAARLTA